MNFSDMLDKRAADVEVPLDLPRGTYIWAVSKIPTASQTASGEWNIVEFPIKSVSAEDDVDPDEIEEFGNVSGQPSRISFMFPTDPDKENDFRKTENRMKAFMIDTLRAGDDEMTLKELMAASVNCQFMGIASYKVQGENSYLEVKNYSALD